MDSESRIERTLHGKGDQQYYGEIYIYKQHIIGRVVYSHQELFPIHVTFLSAVKVEVPSFVQEYISMQSACPQQFIK